MRWVAWIVTFVAYLATSTALNEIGWAKAWLVRYGLAIILMFFVVLVHELGHAAAVLRVGGTIKSIMVFPLHFDVKARRLGFASLNTRGDVGGYVSYAIDRIATRRKYVIVAAAGPLANVAGAALAILIAQQSHGLAAAQTHPSDGTLPSEAEFMLWLESARWAMWIGWCSALATGFALLSLGMAVANLLPFAGSDGTAILRGLFPRLGPNSE